MANPGCDMNWNQWWVGSRTQWNVTKDFYMGLDVAYVKFDTAQLPGGVTGGTNSPAPVTNGNTALIPGGHQYLLAVHQQRRQLAGSLPRPSRLLSLIALIMDV